MELSTDEIRQLHDRTAIGQYIHTIEAATLLGVAPQTMRRWACEGSGPIRPRKVAGRLRWSRRRNSRSFQRRSGSAKRRVNFPTPNMQRARPGKGELSLSITSTSGLQRHAKRNSAAARAANLPART